MNDLQTETAATTPKTAKKRVYQVDMDRLTLGEVELMEEIAGAFPDSEEALAKMSSAKLILACGLIALRRENPEATLDDARALEIDQVEMANSTPT